MNDKAILVVSFGTSYLDTLKVTISAIEEEIAKANPDWQVRRAFTSGMVLQKLKTRANMQIDNVSEAMDRMLADGIRDVIIQPTHVISGCEYDAMIEKVLAYRDKFESLRCGKPLLYSHTDYREVARAMVAFLDPAPDEALVLMGHGTPHSANSAYPALNDFFRRDGLSNVYVGTVEGFPTLEDVLDDVQESGLKRVLLAPLMVVAGDHAINDMASEEEGSWKKTFEAAGFSVRCHMGGMGEIPAVRGVYVRHTAEATDKRPSC